MVPAMKNFDVNEKLLSLESEIESLKEIIENYEGKCIDMDLEDMIEERDETISASFLHECIAATHSMNKYFENKLENLNKENHNG